MTTTLTRSQPTKPPAGQILRLGGLTALVATAINAVLFIFSSTFTFPPTALTPMGVPVALPAVAGLTLLGGLAATAGYLVLTRIFSVKIARIILWVVAVVVLLMVATTPLTIANAPIIEIVMLEIMHLVAGLLPVWRLAQI